VQETHKKPTRNPKVRPMVGSKIKRSRHKAGPSPTEDRRTLGPPPMNFPTLPLVDHWRRLRGTTSNAQETKHRCQCERQLLHKSHSLRGPDDGAALQPTVAKPLVQKSHNAPAKRGPSERKCAEIGHIVRKSGLILCSVANMPHCQIIVFLCGQRRRPRYQKRRRCRARISQFALPYLSRRLGPGV
jgi:hypothetical protein